MFRKIIAFCFFLSLVTIIVVGTVNVSETTTDYFIEVRSDGNYSVNVEYFISDKKNIEMNGTGYSVFILSYNYTALAEFVEFGYTYYNNISFNGTIYISSENNGIIFMTETQYVRDYYSNEIVRISTLTMYFSTACYLPNSILFPTDISVLVDIIDSEVIVYSNQTFFNRNWTPADISYHEKWATQNLSVYYDIKGYEVFNTYDCYIVDMRIILENTSFGNGSCRIDRDTGLLISYDLDTRRGEMIATEIKKQDDIINNSCLGFYLLGDLFSTIGIALVIDRRDVN